MPDPALPPARLAFGPGGVPRSEPYDDIYHAADGGPLSCNTAEALARLEAVGLAPEKPIAALRAAWRLEQDLTQLMKLALTGAEDIAQEPKGFRLLLAKAGGARDLKALRAKLERARTAARAAYEAVVDR